MTPKTRIKLLSKVALILFFGLGSAHVFSQANSRDNTQTQWYQINVIIFERLSAQALNDKEHWPKDTLLSYPTNIKYLEPIVQAQTLNNEADTSILSNTNETDVNNDIEAPEKPFVLLAPQEQALATIAHKFKRSNKYHVLFHESWRQPFTDSTASPAIIIQGGRQFDDHHELKGTLTFSLSRFLHVKSDLWLTHFESNYGQATGQWGDLPKAPQNLNDLVFEQTLIPNESTEPTDTANTDNTAASSFAITNTTANTDTLSTSSTNNNALGRFTINADIEKPAPSLDDDFATALGNKKDIFNSKNPLNLGLNDDFKINDIDKSDINKNYIIKKIITMRQTRRMRSEETHYIDHPKLGIVVKITPYEKPNDAQKQTENTLTTN